MVEVETSLIAVGEMPSHRGLTIQLQGHVQAIRDLGQIMFLLIRDQSGVVQIIVEQPELLEIARKLSPETAVRVEGVVVPNPKSADSFELHASRVTALSETAEPLPVEIGKADKMKNLSLSTMLDYRPITLRSPSSKAVFKIEASFCAGFREFLNSQNFTEIHSPKIVSTGTEGGAQLFKIDYFGTPAYLAQSPQFYKQIMVGVFERVFEIGPVYRAEEHDTTRHLNEYISMDFEMGFIESEQDLIAMQTKLLKHMFETVGERCTTELALFGAKIPTIATIPQISLAEAVALLEKTTKWRAGKTSEDAIPDLDPEGERLLTQHFATQERSELVYVTKYPHSVRPFYAMPLHETRPDGREIKLSRSFDLLYRGLEITTGGQRIHNPTALKQSISERGLDPSQFGDYLQCFRYGMPPHGGLAIGLERLTKQLLELPTVKLAALFPRDINRLRP